MLSANTQQQEPKDDDPPPAKEANDSPPPPDLLLPSQPRLPLPSFKDQADSVIRPLATSSPGMMAAVVEDGRRRPAVEPQFKDQVRSATPPTPGAVGVDDDCAAFGPQFKDQVRPVTTTPPELVAPPGVIRAVGGPNLEEPAVEEHAFGSSKDILGSSDNSFGSGDNSISSKPQRPSYSHVPFAPGEVHTESQPEAEELIIADAAFRQDAIEIPAAYLVEESKDNNGRSPAAARSVGTIGLCIFVLILAAVVAVVGGVCGSGKCSTNQAPQQQGTETQTLFDEKLLASFRFRTGPKDLPRYATAELRLENNAFNVSTGTQNIVGCSPQPCHRDENNCLPPIKVYEPGCCLGSNCSNREDWCGGSCPSLSDGLPCKLTDPNNDACVTSDCYTCDKVDGEDVWNLSLFVQDINCLSVGTATSEENGELFKWAITCGPVVAGGRPELNFGIGEYVCMAFRQGAGFSPSNGGVATSILPCQFIQLGECGCAPADVVILGGLDPPNGTCVDERDCPFLCGDAGLDKAQNLCNAFEGIEWWNGNNFNKFNAWDTLLDIEELEIYIKGVDI